MIKILQRDNRALSVFELLSSCCIIFILVLKDLVNKQLTSVDAGVKMFGNSFLKPFRTDHNGILLDPFINRYLYDPGKWSVVSQTKGYERW